MIIDGYPEPWPPANCGAVSTGGTHAMSIHFEAGIVLCLASRRHEELERFCLQGGRFFLVGPWSTPSVMLQIGRHRQQEREKREPLTEVCIEVEPLLLFLDEPEPTDVHIERPRGMWLRHVDSIASRLSQEWQRAQELRTLLLAQNRPVPEELLPPGRAV